MIEGDGTVGVHPCHALSGRRQRVELFKQLAVWLLMLEKQPQQLHQCVCRWRFGRRRVLPQMQGSVAYPASDLSSSNPARLPTHSSLFTMQTSCSASTFNGAAVVSKAATNKGAPDWSRTLFKVSIASIRSCASSHRLRRHNRVPRWQLWPSCVLTVLAVYHRVRWRLQALAR